MTGDSNHNVEGLAKSRIEALSDGIFAISMTLLVLSLTVPAIAESDAPDLLPGLIAGMYPDFLFFAIAFFILGGYWMAHHRILQSVEYVDERFIWLNLFLLFFIVLIPFSTSL
ncbi:MAG: TMEM175 family protein, partial [Methanoregulaceae archaeon]